MHQTRLLTKVELAETLNVSVRTIDNWMASRTLPYIKVNRLVRFNIDEVLKAFTIFEVRPYQT